VQDAHPAEVAEGAIALSTTVASVIAVCSHADEKSG
jgi:hypothetical protein